MCGAYTGEDAARGSICGTCLRFLPRTEQAEHPQNETMMAVLGQPSDIVRAAKVMHLSRAAAFLFYEKDSPVQGLVHKMKYADQPEAGMQLARQAAMEFQYAGFWDGIDLIVPMPLHPKRLRSRGYNQSEYIAHGISEVTGIPVDTTHVLRVKDTPKQALQSGEDRKRNVEDAFAVIRPEQLYHRHILLVDDLVTTGETARACLRAMRSIRGATFSVFALCKAR